MMRSHRVSTPLMVACLVIAVPTRATSQAVWQFGLGPSVTLTRPGDRQLWGASGQLRKYLAPVVVMRGYGSMHLVHDAGVGGPVMTAVGGEIGFTLPESYRRQTLAWTLSVGGSLVHFAGGRRMVENCGIEGCETHNRGYDPGLVAAATAALGVEVRTASDLALYADGRVHVPLRLGANGYASDPHAAFVSIAMGLVFGY